MKNLHKLNKEHLARDLDIKGEINTQNSNEAIKKAAALAISHPVKPPPPTPMPPTPKQIKVEEKEKKIQSENIEKGVKKANNKKEVQKSKTYVADLKNFKKVKADDAVKNIHRKIKKTEKLTNEYNKQKLEDKSIDMTRHHYKEYLTSCQSQIASCVSYCNKGHLFDRHIDPTDQTVSYKCGGYNHPLQKCSSEKFLSRVKDLRTCANTCILEGRCITFFKNEYNGIHSLCGKIHDQCLSHFCPGNMIEGHLSCLMDCGGELCGDVFEASHQIKKYQDQNNHFTHKQEGIVEEDNSRPKKVPE